MCRLNMNKEIYQLFRDYKEEEAKKILQIIHACTAISSAALISEGMTPNSGFLVLAILGNALTYAYWYFADTGVYRMNEMLLTNSRANADVKALQGDKTAQSELRKAVKRSVWSNDQFYKWRKSQINFQIKCFIFSLFSWLFAVAGLTLTYVVNVALIDSKIHILVICVAVLSGMVLTAWDYSKVIKMSLQEEPNE